MTTPVGYIDGNAINEQSWPGTATGTAIISGEAVSTTTAVANVVTLIHSLGAATSGGCSTTASITLQFPFLATVNTGAETSTPLALLRRSVALAALAASAAVAAAARLRLRPSISQAASAGATASTILSVRRNVATAAGAVGVAGIALRKAILTAGQDAKATCVVTGEVIRRRINAATVATAEAAGFSIGLLYRCGATASCLATSSVSAVDFTSTILAPDDRKITVPANDRLMEVAA